MFIINGVRFVPQSFPDNTPRLFFETDEKHAKIEWYFEANEELITLIYITKHLKESLNIKSVSLYMPYIPNARMDRIKNRGEVFTLKYFAEIINSLMFESVTVRDAHSSVSTGLIDRVIQEPVDSLLRSLAARLLPENGIVFFPDEGACKRYSDMLGRGSIFGIKNRDWKTGKITSFEVHGELPKPGFCVLMIDDIASYGGTMLHSAKRLSELGADKIYMYVTHCENSILEGELINSGLLTKIFTTRSIFTKSHPLIEVLEL